MVAHYSFHSTCLQLDQVLEKNYTCTIVCQIMYDRSKREPLETHPVMISSLSALTMHVRAYRTGTHIYVGSNRAHRRSFATVKQDYAPFSSIPRAPRLTSPSTLTRCELELQHADVLLQASCLPSECERALENEDS